MSNWLLAGLVVIVAFLLRLSLKVEGSVGTDSSTSEKFELQMDHTWWQYRKKAKVNLIRAVGDPRMLFDREDVDREVLVPSPIQWPFTGTIQWHTRTETGACEKCNQCSEMVAGNKRRRKEMYRYMLRGSLWSYIIFSL